MKKVLHENTQQRSFAKFLCSCCFFVAVALTGIKQVSTTQGLKEHLNFNSCVFQIPSLLGNDVQRLIPRQAGVGHFPLQSERLRGEA